MSKNVSVEVEVDPEKSVVEGRNGDSPICRLKAWKGETKVFLDGVGVRGKPIRGGFMIPVEAMDELARRWLTARGIR